MILQVCAALLAFIRASVLAEPISQSNSNRKEVLFKHFFLTLIILFASGCSSANSSLHVFEKCFEPEIFAVSDFLKNTHNNYPVSISYFPIGEEFGEPEISLLRSSGFDGYILKGKDAWAIDIKQEDILNFTGTIVLKKSGFIELSVGLKDRYYLVVISDRGRYLFDAKIATPSTLKSRVNEAKCLAK